MEKRFNINLDLKRKSAQLISGLKKGDNNSVLYIKLLQDSLAYNLTGLTVRVNLRRPDGAVYFQGDLAGVTIIDATQGDFKVNVLSEALDIIGELNADVSIFDVDNNKVSSATFKMLIEDSVYSGEAIPNRQGADLIQTILGSEQARIDAEVLRITKETERINAETARVSAESSRVTAEATRVTEFAGIKDQVKLVDITPVTTVRNQIVVSPTGTYSYAGGQTIDANKLVTIEQNAQVEINYGFDFQVVGTNVINKSTYANELVKFINDNTNMGVLK